MIASTAGTGKQASGIRLLDPCRDLNQVADLIEESFAGELGPAGRAAIRDFRMMAGISSLLWLGSRLSSDFQEAFTGFVWVEDGRVVGNVSLSRSASASTRWQIANVAVAPSHRGQGIARRLMETALDYLHGRGAEWAILQVRYDNPVALHLYHELGFERIGTHTELYLEGPYEPQSNPRPPIDAEIGPSARGEWINEYELARECMTPLERWARDMDVTKFRRGWLADLWQWLAGKLGASQMVRIAARRENRMVGLVRIHTGGWWGDAHIALYVHPSYRGAYETPLLHAALARLRLMEGQTAQAEHSIDHPEGVAAFKNLGFRERRTLVTMRRRIT